ncbi:MAG TPA: N-acetylmuramoyl-L-alanine amidase [Clostridium sp.]|uniref:N-acetylmuramoyl-L-alanine amidase n=1 Tax=Clostridium sp. TaxID=1506 RepID=UPI002F943FF5
MLKIKKLIIIFMCLIIIGGVFYRTTYEREKQKKYIQTIKINKENKIKKEKYLVESHKKNFPMVVVIDPGHSNVTNLRKEQQAPGSNIMKIKESGGTQGINTKTPEYVVNMEVAVKLKSLLAKKGYTVIMTKTKNNQSLGNIARAEVGNKINADLVIRIHADGNENSSVKGASMLVPANTKNTNIIYKPSKKYGQIIFNSLIKNVGMNNRGVVERSDMTGFNWSKVPVILVEMGFQSNATEDKLLITDSYQDKIAKSLAEGIDLALR